MLAKRFLSVALSALIIFAATPESMVSVQTDGIIISRPEEKSGWEYTQTHYPVGRWG